MHEFLNIQNIRNSIRVDNQKSILRKEIFHTHSADTYFKSFRIFYFSRKKQKKLN